jgi:hypothetical protein
MSHLTAPCALLAALAVIPAASGHEHKRDKAPRRRPGASASSRRLIPKTRIPDTRKNRAVIAVVEAYRRAMVRRDAKALARLAHPAYHDDAGTPAPHDDIDRRQLLRTLRTRLGALRSVDYRIACRKVGWPRPTRAEIDASISATYELALPGGGSRRLRHQDRNRFVLERHRGRWLFLCGM